MSANRKRGLSRPARSATPNGRATSGSTLIERRGARDLAASHLHGDVRNDARHGDQRRDRQRCFGEARALTGVRLPAGGQVDRGRPLAFTFDGEPYMGFAGDSIASALLANGVRIVGRSFKYHRPRGVWGAWTEEPNAIVDVTRNGRTTPNLRATTEPLENDIAVRSVNAAPTAAADRAALIDRLAPLLPAGFYYKTILMAAVGDVRRFDPRHGRPRPCGSEQSPAGRQFADQRALRSACRWRRARGSGRSWRRRSSGSNSVSHRRSRRDRRPTRPSRRRDRRWRMARLGSQRRTRPRSRGRAGP